MPTLQVTGVEALVRWQHPDMGLVFPGQSIGLAEETGLILPLGDSVLRTACAQMKSWLEGGADLETMAVNLSAHQFRQPDVVDDIARILMETGLPAVHLELEITESALMDFGQETEKRLKALKALGVRLAIDDFGTGYPSLAYPFGRPLPPLELPSLWKGTVLVSSA